MQLAQKCASFVGFLFVVEEWSEYRFVRGVRAHMRVDKDISQVKSSHFVMNSRQETTRATWKPIECALEASSGGSGGDWT